MEPKLTNIDKEKQSSRSEQTQNFLQSGLLGSARKEAFPLRITTEAEDLWSGLHNCHIVLGKDRNGDITEGRGSKGQVESGMVHIVAGHYGGNMGEFSPTTELGYANPSFMFDSSYIYLSQRSDIDDYLELKPGTVGRSIDKSCIAIKADDVRIVGERGIKLVTTRFAEDSRRQQSVVLKGIDLIAGNDDSDLQPIVKGLNAKDALREMSEIVHGLVGAVINLAAFQMKANSALSIHEHTSNVPAKPTLPFKEVMKITCNGANQNINDHTIKQCQNLSKKIDDFRETYLEFNGKKYISSKYNHTN